jgi:hypothetical protein
MDSCSITRLVSECKYNGKQDIKAPLYVERNVGEWWGDGGGMRETIKTMPVNPTLDHS